MSEEDRISLARLEEKVDGIVLSDKEYRGTLCIKMNKMEDMMGKVFNRFDKLPCRERGLGTKLMWAALGVLGTLLFYHLGWK